MGACLPSGSRVFRARTGVPGAICEPKPSVVPAEGVAGQTAASDALLFMSGSCGVQGGKQGGREHLRVVPPTSLPYSEGFDSPSKASPASSTSSTSLGARSAPCLHLSGSPMLLQQFPNLAGQHFGLPPWKTAQHQCLRPPFICLNLNLPQQQHCVDLLRARWTPLLPCCLPHTATPEDVRPAAALGCCCCVDSTTSHKETAAALVVLCLVQTLCMLSKK